MPILPDINLGSLNRDDPQKQLESLVAQLNEWGRLISNETLTRVYNDESGTPRIIFGLLPDGTIGLVISEEGVDVTTLFT